MHPNIEYLFKESGIRGREISNGWFHYKHKRVQFWNRRIPILKNSEPFQRNFSIQVFNTLYIRNSSAFYISLCRLNRPKDKIFEFAILYSNILR